MTTDPVLIEAEREHGRLRTSDEVCRILSLTPRQIQWWDEKHIVCPAFQLGHKRYYGEKQLRELSRLASLRKAGASLQSCRKLLKLKNWNTAVSARNGVVIGDVLVVP
jgi:DNA-binding transcriptional MerR regulator